MKHVFFLVLLSAAFSILGAVPATDVVAISQEQRLATERLQTRWVSFDRNGNGKTDYMVQYSDRGVVMFEEYDYNHDGIMDDFCFYQAGTMVMEQIDSDYNGRVDIWVHLEKGIYISKIEKDTDNDGIADVRKDYAAAQVRR